MVNNGSNAKLFAGVGLAVPSLGNVRLYLHFLSRGTSGGAMKKIFIIFVLLFYSVFCSAQTTSLRLIMLHNGQIIKNLCYVEMVNPSDSTEFIKLSYLPGLIWFDNKDSIIYRNLKSLDSIKFIFNIHNYLESNGRLEVHKMIRKEFSKSDLIIVNIIDRKKFAKRRINNLVFLRKKIKNKVNILCEVDICNGMFCIPDDEIVKFNLIH